MRLKFLFFPIMLVISISFFIGYVWPEIGSVRAMNQEKLDNEATLRAIKEKQAAIEKIGTQISKDNTGEMAINNYLPNQKVEERILSGVNFLATDSGVSLINVSLKDASTDTVASGINGQNIIANIIGGASNAVNVTGSVAPSTGQAVKQTVDGVQYTQASIDVSGEYSKIRLFADQLQHMPIMNKTKSFLIKAVQVKDEESAEQNAGILTATIVMDFAFLDSIKIDNQKIAGFKQQMDDATIATLSRYVSQKAPGANSSGDSNGKLNPFLP